jgi:hypothetical protein
MQGYGTGVYGAGEYPGYKAFLPFVSKKGD